MYVDNEILLASAWSPTATGDNISTNTYDTNPLGNNINTNTGREIGAGEPLFFYFLVTASVTSAGAATVSFQFVTDSTSAISTPNILMQTGLIPKATLITSAWGALALPRGRVITSVYKRYIGADANIGTAVLTAGTFYVALVRSLADDNIYQPGNTMK